MKTSNEKQPVSEKKLQVLLVEDDEDDYVLTRDLLVDIYGSDFSVKWTMNFGAALDEMREGKYDICLFDYRLGAETGLDLLRAARHAGYEQPIILLTGQGDREIDIEAMKAGASDYLIKHQLEAALLERAIRYSLEQKRIEEERLLLASEQHARARAEADNQAKDEFLAMVSHELRTPLNAMLGWLRLLRINKTDEKIFDRAIDAIERSALAQAKFIEDLLDTTRIVNGNLRLEIQSVELASVIKSAVDGLHPAADVKNLTLKAKLEETIISGDPERLQQIMNNLLSNAIKFTPEGGHIEILLRVEGAYAKITVKDTGKGISMEFLPFVFDRYRQAETTLNRREGGLRLGLAIVKRLVEMHEGQIVVDSAGEGRGTTFTITFPLSAERFNS